MDTRTICLALLSRGEASGYEIKKSLEEGPYPHIQEIGFGSIYPALAKLREEGHLSVRAVQQAGRPDKKLYRLTPSGLERLRTSLAERAGPDHIRSDFLFKMLFAELMPGPELCAEMEARADALRQKLAHMESCPNCNALSPGEEFVHGYGLVLYRTMEAYIRQNIAKMRGSCGVRRAAEQERLAQNHGALPPLGAAVKRT